MFNETQVLGLAGEVARPFEGLSLTPYHDPVGFPTIGYGHLLSRIPYADLSQWPEVSEQAATHLLHQDMVYAYTRVLALLRIKISDAQAATLTDFAFNCGAGNLQASTLLKKLNQGMMDEVPAQLTRWVYARGQKLPGLVRRRAAEAILWQN